MLVTRDPLFGVVPPSLVLLGAVLVAGGLFAAGMWRLYRLMRLGKSTSTTSIAGRPVKRAKGMLFDVLLQRRLLAEPYGGVMHALIFWGFAVVTVMTAHTFLAGLFPGFDLPAISRNPILLASVETFMALVLLALSMALLRRLVLRPQRLTYNADAYTVLALIAVLMATAFLTTSTSIAYDVQPWDRWAYLSQALAPAWVGLEPGHLLLLHRVSWWTHVLTVLAFLAYLPRSKHLHVVTAPLNVWLRNLGPRGRLPYRDVEAALEAGQPLGAGEVTELTWKDLLDSLTCTECGRCEAACPASSTGKPLSPKRLMTDLRQYLVRHGPALLRDAETWSRGDTDRTLGGRRGEAFAARVMGFALTVWRMLRPYRPLRKGPAPNGNTGTASPPVRPALVGETIAEEVLWDCTTCRACVDACPVLIDHVPKIVDMRRHLVMEQTRFGPEAQRLFDNLEASGNPWRFPRATRGDWAAGLGIPILGEVSVDDVDLVYWVGCAGAYDERYQKVTRAFARLLQHAGVRFAILGPRETCTGDAARRAGHEYLFQTLARQNVDVLNACGVKKIVATCAHCFNTLQDEYPELGGQYEVIHHSELLAQLVREGRLRPAQDQQPGGRTFTYHDPCYIGRYHDLYEPPRDVLRALPGLKLREIPQHNRARATCCGAGGARAFMEETRGTRINHLRLEQAEGAQPDGIATSCPYCIMMLEDAARAKGRYDTLPVRDIAELLDEWVEAAESR
ncbi:MAG: hypothetical protein HY332_17320 [Chloroflexi bacterium]|nr:hypothetical protein [Chloroflexota bacterium]